MGGGSFSLRLENFVTKDGDAGGEDPVPRVAEGKGYEGGGQLRLGSWLITSRIRQPWPSRVSGKGRRDLENGKEPLLSSNSPSSPPRTSSTPNTSSPTHHRIQMDGRSHQKWHVGVRWEPSQMISQGMVLLQCRLLVPLAH